jgi:hypothetical protein
VTADSDPVGKWSDQSGNGYHLTMAGANRPLYRTNILNSYPVIRFDGVNDYLENTSALSNIASASGYVLFVVFKTTNISTDSHAGAWTNNQIFGSTGTGHGFGMGLQSTGPTFFPYSYNNGERWQGITFNSASYGIASVRMVNGQILSSYNTSYVTTSAAGNNVSDLTKGVRLGTNGDPATSGYFTGDIAEVLVFNSSLTDAEFQRILAYLNAKYLIY